MTVVQLPTRFTIGGSEAAAAAGIDPHRSRVGLWLEKTGRVQREETEAMRWGTLLQPLILAELCEHGYRATPFGHQLRDEDRRWLAGHPDGFVYEGEDEDEHGILLEVKTVGQWAKRKWNGQPPLAYAAQVQHYLHLTGLARALLAVLVGGQRLELTEIKRNDRWIATLIELEEEFLERYLKPDLPPPVRHDDADNLARMFPEHKPGRKVRLARDALDVLAELRKRTAQKDAIERQCEQLRNQLKATIGDAETALDAHGDEVIRWKAYDQTRLRRGGMDVLRHDHRAASLVYSELVETKPVRRFELV